MKSALAVLALFLGQSAGLKIHQKSNTLGYEQEGIQVLVDTGNHIEMGVRQSVQAVAEIEAKSEQRNEAQNNL